MLLHRAERPAPGFMPLPCRIFQYPHAGEQLRHGFEESRAGFLEFLIDLGLLKKTRGLGRDSRVSRLGRLLRFGKRLQEARQSRTVDLDAVRLLQVADDL